MIYFTYFFDPHNFYEYLLQKNIDDYEEQNKGVKVRESNVYFKFLTIITLNEANMHYNIDGIKEIFAAEEIKMEMLNNQLIGEFENLKDVSGEDSPDLIETKNELYFC